MKWETSLMLTTQRRHWLLCLDWKPAFLSWWYGSCFVLISYVHNVCLYPSKWNLINLFVDHDVVFVTLQTLVYLFLWSYRFSYKTLYIPFPNHYILQLFLKYGLRCEFCWRCRFRILYNFIMFFLQVLVFCHLCFAGQIIGQRRSFGWQSPVIFSSFPVFTSILPISILEQSCVRAGNANELWSEYFL